MAHGLDNVVLLLAISLHHECLVLVEGDEVMTAKQNEEFEQWFTSQEEPMCIISAKAAWIAARAETEDAKQSRRYLDDAIHAMTDTLDYEWTGDFRKEIENLNGAHMRFSVQQRRLRIKP